MGFDGVDLFFVCYYIDTHTVEQRARRFDHLVVRDRLNLPFLVFMILCY